MLKKEWIKQGFIDEPVAEGTDLKAEIRKMCEAMSKLKLSLVLIDYLQLVGTERVFDNFVEEDKIIDFFKDAINGTEIGIDELGQYLGYIDPRD